MMNLHSVAALLIQATADCEKWTHLVKSLALSEDADLPARIAQAEDLGNVEKTTGQPVSSAHLRQVIVSRMEAAEREFQVLYNAQLELISCGRTEAAPPRVPCAACDRGDYQLGHADGCPAITTQPSIPFGASQLNS